MDHVFFALLSFSGSCVLGYVIGTVFARHGVGIVFTMVVAAVAGLAFNVLLYSFMKSAGAFV